MYYPCVNWSAIWASRPTHVNGDSEEHTQNGTEPMDTSESGVSSGTGSVALRQKRKAATIHVSHPQQRSSYHEALKSNEVGGAYWMAAYDLVCESVTSLIRTPH